MKWIIGSILIVIAVSSATANLNCKWIIAELFCVFLENKERISHFLRSDYWLENF